MAAITRLGLDGYGVKRAGSFAGKEGGAPPPAVILGLGRKSKRYRIELRDGRIIEFDSPNQFKRYLVQEFEASAPGILATEAKTVIRGKGKRRHEAVKKTQVIPEETMAAMEALAARMETLTIEAAVAEARLNARRLDDDDAIAMLLLLAL